LKFSIALVAKTGVHLAAYETKINCSQQKYAWTQQSTQVGNLFLPLEFGTFPTQDFHQRDAFAFRHPDRLRRVVLKQNLRQIKSQRKGSDPSATNITRQDQRSNIHPEKGEETITATGKQSSQNALARARSERGNQ